MSSGKTGNLSHPSAQAVYRVHTYIVEGIALATRVILVRHGISTYNVLGKVQGHCDESTLTDEGREGARRVGLALQGIRLNAAYSSPLKRARETAEMILSASAQSPDQLPRLQFRDDLKEINLTDWEGMSFDEVKRQFPEKYKVWRDRPHELQMQRSTPDGLLPFYPVPALYEQARQFWQAVLSAHSEETILLVAHSGINRALICTAVGLEATDYPAFGQMNCAINVLNFSGDFGQPVQLESVNLTAHLDIPLPTQREGQTGPRLLLVRHGETDWNREKRFQGQIDVPLNERGRHQSEKAAAFLQDVLIDRAVTSPMLRPKETAEIILKSHPKISLEMDDRLCEISHGLWEGKLEEEIQDVYADELAAWKDAPETVQMPAGENLQQVWERAIAAWESIVATAPTDRPTTTLVVAHDATNKAILCHLINRGARHFWTFKQGNCAVTVIDYPKGCGSTPIIQALNITTHLDSGVLDRTAAGAL